MIAVIILLGVLLVGALALAGKHKMEVIDLEERVDELEDKLEKSKIEVDKVRDAGVLYYEAYSNTKQSFLKLKNFLEDGVFYDKQNDTIVLAENLDRIGEL